MAQNWVMMISELHRYQGVSYKSDIIVLSGDCVIHPVTIVISIVIILSTLIALSLSHVTHPANFVIIIAM